MLRVARCALLAAAIGAAAPLPLAAQDSFSATTPAVATLPVLAFPFVPMALAPPAGLLLPVAPPLARPDTAVRACPGCPPKRPLTAVFMGLATNVFINRFDTWVLNVHEPLPDGYYTRVTPQSWGVNIRKGWVFDTDAFQVNMFLHPYQGGTYFRAGRSNGLNFWESAPLTFLGSLEWEYFGEKTFPSLNDFYNTGFGGIVIGETVYRFVSLIRDNRATGMSRVLREVATFPLDPLGTVKRLFSGDLWRVYRNPGEHAPPPLALQVQAGVRQARDLGLTGARSIKGVMIAELSYGDAFASRYSAPFDVFLARAVISPGSTPLGEFRVAGRLYGTELTNPAASDRAIFTVQQKLEYAESPAYKFGGQSLEAGFVAGLGVGHPVELRTEAFVEGIMMGAVDARGGSDTTGIAGTPRTYDFGPGFGIDLAATVSVRHFPVFAARYHWSMVHSVSGSPADHFTQLPSIELALPITNTFGIGAHASWYARRSAYVGRPGEVTTFPDFRAYLVWRTRPRTASPEPQ